MRAKDRKRPVKSMQMRWREASITLARGLECRTYEFAGFLCRVPTVREYRES